MPRGIAGRYLSSFCFPYINRGPPNSDPPFNHPFTSVESVGRSVGPSEHPMLVSVFIVVIVIVTLLNCLPFWTSQSTTNPPKRFNPDHCHHGHLFFDACLISQSTPHHTQHTLHAKFTSNKPTIIPSIIHPSIHT